MECSSVEVMVEIPKGSRNKFEFDEKAGKLRFNRMLYSSMHYPSDYGFIIDTLGGDGDSLDAMVLLWEPTFPGCFIQAKPVGVFKLFDQGKPDEKILCVPCEDPNWNYINDLSGVPPHLLKEIEHFFAVYKDLEMKTTRSEGWADRETAVRVILEAQERYRKSH